jgi:multiple antibiotic resistance protein
MLAHYSELFLSAFVTLFVVIDPPGCAPIFASLTSGAPAAHRRAMAIRSVMVGAAILLIFALFGEALLGLLGISLAAFRVAGGIMLFLIAAEMVFEKRTQRREERAEEISRRAGGEADGSVSEDISVFPIGIPMIAGPGAIATVMLMMSRSHGWGEGGIVLAALATALLLTLLALLAAGPLMRLVGRRIEAVVTRVLGVILAALAAQFVIDGLKAGFA